MPQKNIKLGLKENWQQFTLLVMVNAFVGGMIGIERSIFPQFAQTFGISSHTAILSFITAFGITKALTNYFTGRLANQFGRRNLLLGGWLIALPIPFVLIYATSWNMVIFANILLGISQGLTWSSTVVMKIDLVGEKDRGLAMGLNEFAGYVAVGLVAFLSSYVANQYGISPYPFYIGIFIAFIGFLLTLFFVKDTRAFVHRETTSNNTQKLENIFLATTFRNPTLSAVTQAGLVNNLNDGMIWGLLPIALLSMQQSPANIGIITAIYPTVWGIGQLFTGKMSDIYPKKTMLFWGMFLQGIAILLLPFTQHFALLVLISSILGLGTALVYPTFLATIAQATHPQQRAESIGTFRLWRDLGYAFGAIISGITADFLGVSAAIILIGIITLVSSLIIKIRMPNYIKTPKTCMEVADLRKALQLNQKVQIIDVRTPDEFKQYHIPNAINVSLSALAEQIVQFDKNSQFVTVCGKGGGRSLDGATLLNNMGYRANWLCGGTNQWFNTP